MKKEERLQAINKLIEFISERGRRFFYSGTNGRVGKMILKSNRVYFVDHRTGKEVYAYEGFLHDGFSHGGTVWALVCDFSHFIRTGISSNGKHGYGGLYSGDWGHSKEIQNEIIEYAKETGYLKGDN